MKDSLGDRIKSYENKYRFYFPPKSNIIIRLDGQHFHSLLRKAEKPFYYKFIDAMRYAALNTSKIISGFKFAHIASDEMSIVINDKNNQETEPWFNNNISKIITILSSNMSVYFSEYYGEKGCFDGRAFVIPDEDLFNYFLWRCHDWYRNAINMIARTKFSAKKLNNVKCSDLLKIDEINEIWKNSLSHIKYGSFLFKGNEFIEYYGSMKYLDLKIFILKNIEKEIL